MMKDFFITSLTPEEQLRAKEEELRLVKLTNSLEDPKTKYSMKKVEFWITCNILASLYFRETKKNV